MRVIAGSAGGIRLDVPQANVRPTMDRVKAAIFSSLADAIIGARVLDLFAGTGALGIEALSRGAAEAVFVEQNRAAVKAIEANLARTKFTGTCRQQDVFAYLATSGAPGAFNIIFADPPYEKTADGKAYTDLLLSDERIATLLAPRGIFILEKRPGEPITDTQLWAVTRARKYGATEVLFLRRPGELAE